MQRVIKRYCKALFELALEEGQLNIVEKDLQRIGEIINLNKDFTDILANPVLSGAQKLKLFDDLIDGWASQLTKRFLILLTQKKRFYLLPMIIPYFQAMLLEHRNIIEVEVRSVTDLSEKQSQKIREILQELTGKSVILRKYIDPDMIGGFVVRVGDVLIDNSIRHQLNKLHERLIAP